jgi:t-SNARE complex subunit (syntaxin)
MESAEGKGIPYVHVVNHVEVGRHEGCEEGLSGGVRRPLFDVQPDVQVGWRVIIIIIIIIIIIVIRVVNVERRALDSSH